MYRIFSGNRSVVVFVIKSGSNFCSSYILVIVWIWYIALPCCLFEITFIGDYIVTALKYFPGDNILFCYLDNI